MRRGIGMGKKQGGLGKGLEALLGQNKASSLQPAKASDEVNQAKTPVGHSQSLPVDVIQRGNYQPRRDMHPDTLEDLASSIKSQGIIQPIVVRPISQDRYEIIAGERRWRAAQIAGLTKVPVIIRDIPNESAIAMALIENIQREDLNPIEEAIALQRLQNEFDLTQQEVAEAVGKSRTTVTNLLRLMTLTEEVRVMLEHGDLEMGHARALLTLDSEQQTDIAKTVVAKDLSVRQTEALVRRAQSSKKTPEGGLDEEKINPDIKQLEERLSAKIGTSVNIQHTAKGKGKLIFKYSNLDELDSILNRIQ